MRADAVIEKFGTIGALLAAAACPVCFPMLAVMGTTLGLGIVRPFEGWTFIVFQILVVIAALGNILSFLRHRRTLPLLIGLTAPAIIFFAMYLRFSQPLVYLGLFGLAAASMLNYVANRQCERC
jgi:mercuric ion transport protein